MLRSGLTVMMVAWVNNVPLEGFEVILTVNRMKSRGSSCSSGGDVGILSISISSPRPRVQLLPMSMRASTAYRYLISPITVILRILYKMS